MTGEFPVQRTSNAENVSIWWRHHDVETEQNLFRALETVCWYSISLVDFWAWNYYNDVTMSAMASQITSLAIVYSTVYSGADQRKHQSSASLAFVGNSPVTGEFPAQRASNVEIFPFDDVIMIIASCDTVGYASDFLTLTKHPLSWIRWTREGFFVKNLYSLSGKIPYMYYEISKVPKTVEWR